MYVCVYVCMYVCMLKVSIDNWAARDLAQSVSLRKIPDNELTLLTVYFGNDNLTNANYSLIEDGVWPL